MNDLNALTTLLQLFSRPSGREPAQEPKRAENVSVFARENGLGEIVDPAPKKTEQSNPMLSLLELMTKGGGDGMSSVLPMLMNLFKKPSEQEAVRPAAAPKPQRPQNLDMFSPISFAGYTLISALNKLYSSAPHAES